jgi:hypothetical protein
MLYFSEIHQSRAADLLREAEHERLADIARAARRASVPARGWRRLAGRFPYRGAGRDMTHPADVAGEAFVTRAGRAPARQRAQAADGSIPRPRESVSTHR